MKGTSFAKCFTYAALLTGAVLTSCSLDANITSIQKTDANWKNQIAELDNQISEKTNLMNLYRAKSARFRNQGDRLQFNSENVTEARRYWQLADYYQAEADILQNQIGELQTKRTGLINNRKQVPTSSELNQDATPSP